MDPVVRLNLYHPSTPTVQPFLDAIEDRFQNDDCLGSSNALLAFMNDLQRAILLLKREVRELEVERVISIAKDHLPDDLYREVERTYEGNVPINVHLLRPRKERDKLKSTCRTASGPLPTKDKALKLRYYSTQPRWWAL